MELISTDTVVGILISHWQDRVAETPSYLQAQFHRRHERSPTLDRLVIMQMADGNITTQVIGRDALRKWVYEGERLHAVPLDHAWQEMYKTDQADELYLTPVFLFYHDSHQLLLSERFGPNFTHRLSGHLRREGNHFVVEWTTVWCSTDA